MSAHEQLAKGSPDVEQACEPRQGMSGNSSDAVRVVVVHSGARDRYQVALALAEAGMLECLVTDFFWSEETPFRRWIAGRLPSKVLWMLRQRSVPGLPVERVRLCLTAGIGSFLLDKARWIPFGARRWFTRASDGRLGRVAGHLARRTGANLLSYSYYGHAAFHAAGRSGMLFQMHPHPETMRTLLLQELAAHPDCSASLQQEWELNLPPRDFERLVAETLMPKHSLAASSFTRSSLVSHGVIADSVKVVPYGIDLERYCPDPKVSRDTAAPLRLLFVGRINQRKGIKYLLQALALLPDADLELTVCGRVLDGLELFQQAGQRVRIRPSVSGVELVEAYQQADLFVLPSVAEGFGQVLLESLACGLPILATTHTAAPDLITDGEEGFVVEPRRPDLLADRIAWALANREELARMRTAARGCAERFPWSRFRHDVANYVRDSFGTRQHVREELA